jgi:hypothetical protein
LRPTSWVRLLGVGASREAGHVLTTDRLADESLDRGQLNALFGRGQ